MFNIIISSPNAEQAQMLEQPIILLLALILGLFGIQNIAKPAPSISKTQIASAPNYQAEIPQTTSPTASPKHFNFERTTASDSPQMAQRYS